MTPGDFWTWCVVLALEARCHVTSTLRTPEHNERVGGAASSWHLIGCAADFADFADAENRERLLMRARRVFPVVIDEGDHIHVQAS